MTEDNPQHLLNRELSWLEFNDRVLREGLSADVPLLERLKFLAIVSSNLDEFFMIRVAGLMQQRAAGARKRDPSGLTPAQALAKISERVHRMVQEQSAGIAGAMEDLAQHGLRVLEPAQWDVRQVRFLRAYFAAEILPVLTPLGVQELSPAPLLPGGPLYVAALVKPTAEGDDKQADPRVVLVPVPGNFARFLVLPSEAGVSLARIEDAILANLEQLLQGFRIVARTVCRITRDADVAVRGDDAGDLVAAIEQAVLARRRRAVVRLTLAPHTHRRLRHWLTQWLDLHAEEVYEVPGMLDAAALMEIVSRPGMEDLRYPDWPPQRPRDLLGYDDVLSAAGDHDVLLMHPYDSFQPVIDLVEQAADDPRVLAVKQTLYRTSGDSPIIRALERAAQNGKQVTVLVELMARFEEARNVGWARRLEDAGCHVLYGVAGLKTHAKCLLIVRREAAGIRRYLHLGTGNYNDKTAKLYSDVGLITCDKDLAADASAFFNLLTGYSEEVGWAKLSIAPTGLRQRLEDLIEREMQTATPGQPGQILAKLNSLEDPGLCEALYRASQAGVRIRLNVRGICCLRPGVEGLSENIEVVSIVDRYLEHARIFYFRNGGHEEVYLASADWMTRNLDRRLEVMFPVTDAGLRRRLVGVLELYLSDNVKAWRLDSDGGYQPVRSRRQPLRVQEALYQQAVQAAKDAEHAAIQFKPLSRPQE